MAEVLGKRFGGADFSNDTKMVRVEYDFANDAGAIGVLNLLEADGDCLIKSFHAVVKTACTSGGSATLDVGLVGGDTDAMMSAVAVADLTLNSVHTDPLVEGAPNTQSLPLRVADGGFLAMEIKVATLTAGKIEFVFEVMKD